MVKETEKESTETWAEGQDAIALDRIRDIERDPGRLIRGEELDAAWDDIEKVKP